MDVFKVLGNANRISMLKILMKQSTHISGLAKELSISVPVALRHTNILEEAGFVERQKAGNTHFLKVREEAVNKIRKAFQLFDKPLVLSVPKGTKMLDVLRKVGGIRVGETSEGAFITEVDGRKGYFIYEIDGRLPNEPTDKFTVTKSVEVELKQLLPVVGKRIRVVLQE